MGATTGSVAGKVTFQGSWPSTGEVQVSIYSNLTAPYIPMGPPDAATDPITSGSSEYNYIIAGLDKGVYTAIYVGWRDPANPAGARLLGMYWVYEDSVGISASSGLPVAAPSSVTISSTSLNHTGLDIKADLDLAP
ncbi:MAG: hypothetical protein HY770_03105 [Chitinivibrionia bacterium]|nr:hypothetical protein [Chitinivibrionia bacterium]